MSRSIATTLVLVGLGLVLPDCGYSTGYRAASDGLLGAGHAITRGATQSTS